MFVQFYWEGKFYYFFFFRSDGALKPGMFFFFPAVVVVFKIKVYDIVCYSLRISPIF